MHNFDRTILSGFAMREFATKEDLNKRKQVILKSLVSLKINKIDQEQKTLSVKCFLF